MNRKPNFLNVLLSMLVGATLLLSAAQPNLVAASSEVGQGEGIRTSVHPQTGKLSFLGADSDSPIRVEAAMRTDLSADSRGLAILDVYGGQFGLKNPQEELRFLTSHETEGRATSKYQQLYQGIPVMAGELIVNTNAQGGLLSINGEVSPDLNISTAPSIDAAQAQSAALREIASAYGLQAGDLTASEPELWIYDARLMNGEDTTPAHLVWRMEVTSENVPLRELALVNAQSGEISLHFNQVDTAWTGEVAPASAEEDKAKTDKFFVAEPVSVPVAQVNIPFAVDATLKRFVATTGSDAGGSNTCTDFNNPCATINHAISKAVKGQTIGVAEGVYSGGDTEVVLINKSVKLSGGWNADFSAQTGYSTIDGQKARNGVRAPYNAAIVTTASLDRFKIINGNSSQGGGIYSAVSLTISNSIIAYNAASGNGGGIYVWTKPLTLINSSVHSNDGGGIFTNGSMPNMPVVLIQNSTISQNNGSGIVSSFGGKITIVNSTVSNNQGRGVAEDQSNKATTILRNSIVAGNITSMAGPDCYGTLTSEGYNIIGDTSFCTITAAAGDRFNVDPKLSVFLPAVGYQPILAGSPAINHGNASNCPPKDQRQAPRVGICDIGAYEYTLPGAAFKIYANSGENHLLGPGRDIVDLGALVVDIKGTPVSGVKVTFTAPSSGPSGQFPNGSNVASFSTDVRGVAKPPAFTTNNQLGSFVIEASKAGLAGSASFNVTTELWYVKATGGSDANDCKTSFTPCATLHGVFYRDDFYTDSVVWITAEVNPYDFDGLPFGIVKSADLIGGWDATFTTQAGYTEILGTIELSHGFSGTPPVFHFDHVDITPTGASVPSDSGINLNDCTLRLTNSFIHGGYYGIASSHGKLTIENSSISGSQNGGIHAEFGEAKISNSTISDNSGSGFYQYNNTAVVENSSITNNTALNGGGIQNDLGSSLYLNNSVVTGNTATESGGGIYHSGALMEINHSTIQNNRAIKSGVTTFGGGIYTSGQPKISNSHVTKNFASQGGGIYSNNAVYYLAAKFTLNRTIVDMNTAQDGAGLWLSGPASIVNSSIIKNTATGKGGGLYLTISELAISNTTISGNIADFGGAVYNGGAGNNERTSTFLNVTISKNRGGTAGGIVSENAAWPIALANTLIIGNIGSIVECDGLFVSNGHNLIGSIGNAATPKCEGDWSATDLLGVESAKILVSNVLVTTLKKDLATGQWYHPLRLGSPAIDAGNTAASGKNACVATDQIGTARPRGVYCDIGAVESKLNVSPPNPLLVTYDANNKTTLPGTLSCSGNNATCGSADAHVRKAHQNAFSVFSKYLEWHLRNSIDGNGSQIVSTVHYGNNYRNAYWNGHMMVYGDNYGFPLADDIVGHELTHGITQYTSNLFLWYQSGAINESFSDLWGEAIDQANSLGNDASSVMWLIGEDVSGLGAVRSMKMPTSHGQPDSMTSSKYCDHGACLEKNGGAQINSGVNNKAVFLMVNGGTFNGQTITKLPWNKVLPIYYETQVNLLTSGSDYLDLYNYLYQACLNKVGSNGIVKADCEEVRDATLAVKMNLEPATNFNPNISFCPAGTFPAIPDLFYEDFETGTNGWTLGRVSGEFAWSLNGQNAISGTGSLWADDSYGATDAYASMMSLTVPRGAKPFLHFTHMYKFETTGSTYFDGGVLEYSINGGSWIDAKPLFSGGQNYKGAIKTGAGNPLQGRDAFVGDSHGYVQSRYNLSSLAGKYVRFRWRIGTDNDGSGLGWYLDNVHVYKCVSIPAVPVLSALEKNPIITDLTPTFNWADSKPDLHHYELQIASNQSFTSNVRKFNDITASQYTLSTPLTLGKYYWRVRAYNAAGKFSAWSQVWTFTIQ